jgi:hypothetical protein
MSALGISANHVTASWNQEDARNVQFIKSLQMMVRAVNDNSALVTDIWLAMVDVNTAQEEQKFRMMD